jgi:hypothetical protein
MALGNSYSINDKNLVINFPTCALSKGIRNFTRYRKRIHHILKSKVV